MTNKKMSKKMMIEIYDSIEALRIEFSELQGMEVSTIAFKAIKAFEDVLIQNESRREYFRRVYVNDGDCDE